MDANDGRGRFTHRGAEEFARVGEGCSRRAGSDLDALGQPVLPVEAETLKFLDCEPGDQWRKMRGDGHRTVEQRSFARLLSHDATCDLHGCDGLEFIDTTDAFEFSEILRVSRN